MSRKYPPFARQTKLSRWNPNHVFVVTGIGSWKRAKTLNKSGQCGAVIGYSGEHSPDTYRWPVSGMDVTIKDSGTSKDVLEALAHELLKAGANLVAVIYGTNADIAVYRQKEIADAA